jgi:virginiamycin A acetyltransferase
MIASDVKSIMNGANSDGYNFKLSIFYLEMAGKKLWSKEYPNKGILSLVMMFDWYNATIMAGVTIGDGAIIAANTVVKKCRALHNCRESSENH